MRSMIGRVLLALTIAACSSSGGNGGPMDPGNGDELDVSGTWTVTATVLETTCPGVELGAQETEDVVIEHEGSQITFIVEGVGSVTGTIDGETGDFEIDAEIFVPGTGSLTLHESGRFDSESHYTSEETVTVEDEEIACTFRTSDEGSRTSA